LLVLLISLQTINSELKNRLHLSHVILLFDFLNRPLQFLHFSPLHLKLFRQLGYFDLLAVQFGPHQSEVFADVAELVPVPKMPLQQRLIL